MPVENKIPTAEEFAKDSKEKLLGTMIAFAKLHVEAALKIAAENAKGGCKLEYTKQMVLKRSYVEIYKNTILDAYPLENIK